MTKPDRTLDYTALLAEARQLAELAPEDGLVRYLLGSELMACGLVEEGRRELRAAVGLMTPGEAGRYRWRAVHQLRDAGFPSDADEVEAVVARRRSPP